MNEETPSALRPCDPARFKVLYDATSGTWEVRDYFAPDAYDSAEGFATEADANDALRRRCGFGHFMKRAAPAEPEMP